MGPDEIPSELLQAGGYPAALLYSRVNQRIVDTFQWPLMWCGGNIVNVYKNKGDSRNTDDHRGILLSDHAGKAMHSMVKDKIEPNYVAHMPVDQHGAVAMRGTDFASHIVTSAIAVAHLLKLSLFVLFVDLTKAFDRVIRQLVHGWGLIKSSCRHAYLLQLGVSSMAAEWIIEYINECGFLFEQWGVNPTAIALSETLHEHSWFQVKSNNMAITSHTGGRQGCKLGSIILIAPIPLP